MFLHGDVLAFLSFENQNSAAVNLPHAERVQVALKIFGSVAHAINMPMNFFNHILQRRKRFGQQIAVVVFSRAFGGKVDLKLTRG